GHRMGLVGVLLVTLAGLGGWPVPALAGGVVGNGTPGSCTDAAFTSKLSGGGTVTFNCGSLPTIIVSEHTISANTTINGIGGIILSGNNHNRLFTVNSGV